MKEKPRGYLLLLLFLLIFLLSGCSKKGKAYPNMVDTQLAITQQSTDLPGELPLLITTTDIIQPSLTFPPNLHPFDTAITLQTGTPIPTYIQIASDTPIPSNTSIPTEIPALIWNPPGIITAPILLYHHISDEVPDSRYFVSPDDFRAQMQALRDWGYSTITAANLASVIKFGGELPEKPVVITFDDGYRDVYEHAFPIMQELGFNGVIYIYVDHMGLKGFVDSQQVMELAEQGWEIGNHSMTHVDLTKNYSILEYEVLESRSTLERAVGESVYTFAYPYGENDEFVINFVHASGYLAGMGLGLKWKHSPDTLFNLQRIEVYGDYDINKFAELLPWSGN